MDTKKFVIGGIIGGVVYFFLGWLIYGILLMDMLALPQEMADVVQYPPEEFKISFMILSCLAWGFFLSFIFLKWAGISTFAGGLKAGIVIAVFISLSFGFGMMAQFKFGSIPQLLTDVVANSVCTGLAAGAIGWFLGRE